MKKRMTPLELIALAAKEAGSSRGDWFSRLSPDNQNYVYDVRNAMIERPDIAVFAVARKLIEELSLKVSIPTVDRKLREMIADAKTETK